MNPHRSRIVNAVPLLPHVQYDIAKAARALAGHNDNALAARRAEIAALRRELSALGRDIRAAGEECLALAKAELGSALRRYSPNQPRVAAGNPDGGRWTIDGVSGASSDLSDQRADANGRPRAATSNDSRVISDATPNSMWIPGARYAGGIEEGEGENRIRGEPLEGTPAQEARLAVAEARWEQVRNRMRNIDPYWRPPAGVYETIEGSIADLEAKTQAAETHTLELARDGIGPGPFACESIPAQGTGRLNAATRAENNENGNEYGCHTCGVREPGTPSGNWVGDHQPSTALNIFGRAQRIYPQCIACSLGQGGAVMRILGNLR
jgi:hypothetical protein